MGINIFDDRKNKSATVKIISDSPVMKKLIETVLSPCFYCVDGEGIFTVVCKDGDVPAVSGPCIYVGTCPQKLREGQIFMERPLDIEKFYGTAKDIFRSQNLLAEGFSTDETGKVAVFGGREIKLTAREAQLYFLLLSRAGECVSREEIEKNLWGNGVEGNCADVYVCYLRKKLEKIAGPGVLISVRGKGYMLKKP